MTFRTGLAGRIPLPGYVIPIADELIAGRPVGGLVAAVAGKVITLDRETSAKPGDRLILNLPDGKCEGQTIQLVSGRKVTVTTAYSVAPEPELVWCLDADDLAVPLYRVTSVSRPEAGVFEISAVQYDPSKFAHIDTGPPGRAPHQRDLDHRGAGAGQCGADVEFVDCPRLGGDHHEHRLGVGSRRCRL